MERLDREFFQMDTLMLAERLLGKVFVHSTENGTHVMKGRIVETEAYLALNDEACHAWRGMTRRNSVMFGPPGTLYVYFSYGCHYLMNIVSEPEGTAGAVLVRAMEPVEGIAAMLENRKTSVPTNLMSGPGKLTRALEIDLSLNGCSLSGNTCYLESAPEIPASAIGTSLRIGISKSTDLPWRKFILGNPHVSTARASAMGKQWSAMLKT